MNFRDLFRKWEISGIKLNTNFAEVEFKPTNDDEIAAWDMYVELLTRITTQPLEDNDGDESSALESIHKLFEITRNILKEKGKNAKEFTKVAIIVLNQVIRPFTAKWHKKSIAGAFRNSDDCVTFRTELKALQSTLVQYTKLLADMAHVEDLTEIDRTQEE